jgi:hypothetical protein
LSKFMKTVVGPVVRRAAFGLALGTLAGAARAETLRTDSVEGVVFAGSSAGNGTIGGGLAKAINTRWQVIGEIAYVHSHAAEFGVNGHYVFPLRDHPKFTPYALVGLGVLHSGGARNSDTTFGANLGGGLRWQTGSNWGIRPELKMLVGDGVHGRFIVGLYYNFGK